MSNAYAAAARAIGVDPGEFSRAADSERQAMKEKAGTVSVADVVGLGAPAKARRVLAAQKKAAKAYHRDSSVRPHDYFAYYMGMNRPMAAKAVAKMDPQDDANVQQRVESEIKTAQATVATPDSKEGDDMFGPLTGAGSSLAQNSAAELPSVLEKGMKRDGDPLNFASYLRGVISKNWTGAKREREVFDAFTTTGDGAGLVPTQISSEVWYALLGRLAIAEAGAPVITLENGSVQVPVEATAPSAAWVAEGAEIADSGGDFDAGALTPHKIAFLVEVTNEMLLDAPQVADQHIRQSLLNALTRGLNAGFLNGSGTSNEPTGLFTGSPSYAVDKSSTTLTHDMLMEAYWQIVGAGGNPQNVRAIMAPAAAQFLDSIRAGGSSGEYLSASASQSAAVGRVVTDAVSVTSGTPDNTSILVGDFQQGTAMYSFGAMRMDVDTSASFNKDSVVFRVVQRVDVAVRQPSLLKRLDAVDLG